MTPHEVDAALARGAEGVREVLVDRLTSEAVTPAGLIALGLLYVGDRAAELSDGDGFGRGVPFTAEHLRGDPRAR